MFVEEALFSIIYIRKIAQVGFITGMQGGSTYANL
jgi:hypothetical protein